MQSSRTNSIDENDKVQSLNVKSNPNFKFEEFFLAQARSLGFDIDLTLGF
jgi:hypothetical protein